MNRENERLNRIYDIQRSDEIDCMNKITDLSEIDLSGLSYHEMEVISDIFVECAENEPKLSLNLLSQIIKQNGNRLFKDLGSGLIAIGQSNIELTTRHVSELLDWYDTNQKRGLATCIAYLYRGHEQTLVDQFESWKKRDQQFFTTTVDRIIDAYRKDTDEDVDEEFSSELQIILNGLEQIASEEGLDPDQARRSKLIRQITVLLEDIKYHHQDADAQTLRRSIREYPHLQALLGESGNWIDEITAQNKHRLCFMLNNSWRRLDYRSWIRGPPSADHSGDPPSTMDLNHIEILSYYDHCCEVLRPGEDRLSGLRDHILNRDMFMSALAELSVINAFRREFGRNVVEIEPDEPKSGKKPDIKIRRGSNTPVWTEITRPARDIPFSAQEARTMPGNSDIDPPRAYVTKKMRKQLSPIKQSTGELTMLVLGNRSPRIENWNVEDYVFGDGVHIIPEEGDVSNVQFIRGESRLGHEDVEDLDILVNFRTLGDFSGPPYIQGQVFALTDIDSDLLRRIGQSFNTVSEIYTPEEIERTSNGIITYSGS